MDPQQKAIAEEFDSYATGYNGAVNAALGFTGMKVDAFVQAKADDIVATLRRRFGHLDISVLDLGCGVGNYHDLFPGRFTRLVGADVSAACIEQARRLRPHVEYVAYDGANLPLDAGSFDAVYAICVLHHVPVPMWPGFVTEMFRMLKPGGVALIYEHNPRHPLTMKVVNDCPFDADATLLKPAKTAELLAGAGFTEVATRSIITIPPLQVPVLKPVLAEVDRLMGLLPFGTQYVASGIRAA